VPGLARATSRKSDWGEQTNHAEPRRTDSHEYTLANARYMQSLGPNAELEERVREVEALRFKNLPSVPVRMESERRLNAFLKTDSKEEFEALRRGKDGFKG
jgi:hydroxyacylglutathione hydrolase